MASNPNSTKQLIDTTSYPYYVGEAPLGTATSTDDWQITKIAKSGSIFTITQSGQNAVWDDRATEVFN